MEIGKPRLQKGDRVFVQRVNSGCAKNQYATVETVGSKYFNLTEIPRARFYVATWGQATKYSSEYRLWVTEEEYIEHDRRQKLWGKLKAFSDAYKIPEGLTSDRIEQALKALGVEINDD